METLHNIPQEQLNMAFSAALSEFAETQRILAKPYITTEEAAKVYPIGKSTLEKLRRNREGPAFVQVTDNSPVAYTHEKKKKWLEHHRQKVM